MCMGCVSVSQGSNAYIPRSTLDPALIERDVVTNKRIFKVEAANAPDNVDYAKPRAQTYSGLIAWNSSDQPATLDSMSS